MTVPGEGGRILQGKNRWKAGRIIHKIFEKNSFSDKMKETLSSYPLFYPHFDIEICRGMSKRGKRGKKARGAIHFEKIFVDKENLGMKNLDKEGAGRYNNLVNAPLAQLDRALVYGTKG